MATSDRGFASMDDKMQEEIASMGGQASGNNQTTNSQDSDSLGTQDGTNLTQEDRANGGRHSHGGGGST